MVEQMVAQMAGQMGDQVPPGKPAKTRPRVLELLAPAKNYEVGVAALKAGADAIYIGGSGFGARAAAGNSMDDIARLAQLAHRLGARVYLTVNTLLYDDELEQVAALLRAAKDAGVDALIVQDLALLTLPEAQGFELHASTQMNVQSLEQIAWCQAAGMAQVVLPREFSLAQIRACTQAFPDLRFEVFVSGAMCVSVSGACFISEYMTGRSANRGACAQICRLPMELYHCERASASDELVASGHLLSMKDNLRLAQLESLVAAGASSFKIEGRLKDHDYVVNQVTAFRQELDAIIARSSGQYRRAALGLAHAAFVPDVTKTFNRGFTSAYLQGDNSALVDIRTPKSLGERIGTVVALKGLTVGVKLARAATIANGDSFTFFDAHGELSGFRCNTVSVAPRVAQGAAQGRAKGRANAAQGAGAAAQGAAAPKGAVSARAGELVYLSLAQALPALKVGQILQRNVDSLFIKAINQPKALSCKVKLHATLTANAQGLTVAFADDWGRSGAAGAPWSEDEGVPELKYEVALSKLTKLGDELLSLSPADITVTPGSDSLGRMALSAFNALRRAALERYQEAAARTWAQALAQGAAYLDPNNPRAPFAGLPPDLGTLMQRTLCAQLSAPGTAPTTDATVAVFSAGQIDRRLLTNARSRELLTKINGELPPPPARLEAQAVMTCRHCLVKNHGRCKKDGGSTTGYYLKIGKHQFDVVTDCRRCLMYLVPRP